MSERRAGPRRFFERAEIEPGGEGYRLVLDGRPARTPGRALLVLPNAALGEAVAAEWAAQGAVIDPATMPLTRLANTAIDGVAPTPDAVRDDLARFAASDLVMYRAGDPEALVAEQDTCWNPILDWARTELGARFVLSQGITFVEQPALSLERVRDRLAAEASPFRLAALHVLTTLSGSVLLALMHASGALDADAAWNAAHVDELFQESRWGADVEALARREARRAEFGVASRMLDLTRASDWER